MKTMINVEISFFENLNSEDIIYHYTKASTAIDFILYKNELRFNKARLSNDPIESKKPERCTISMVETEISKSHSDDVDELHAFIDDLEERFNQICFCQNSRNKNYISSFEGNEELFGFTKLRMWDQYADKFSGVCIAFSKEKILSLNKHKFDLIEDNVSYLTFKQLYLNKVGHIQIEHLKNFGKEKYKEQLENSLKQSFFYKHNDYSGENEYRIGTFFDKRKCSVEKFQDELFFDKNMMLDISGCIEAIFVSSYANDKQKNALLEYADKLNIKLVEMQWKYNSFVVNDYKDWKDFIDGINKRKIKKQKPYT